MAYGTRRFNAAFTSRLKSILRIDSNFFKIHFNVVLSCSILILLSSFLSFSLPDKLYDPTDLILRHGTPFKAMTSHSLHRRSLSSVYDVNAYVMSIAIRRSDGDVKPGGPVWCFCKRVG
jgi:hypothetical protein